MQIRRGDKWKTEFITPTGHYEYLVMPYSLVNAPFVFQDFMHNILHNLLHKFVLIYIDNILIYSENPQQHHDHVTAVLKRLREHHLFLKAEKCSFHKESIHFQGYNISPQGISMDMGEVTAVRKWSVLANIKELQRFLAFALLPPFHQELQLYCHSAYQPVKGQTTIPVLNPISHGCLQPVEEKVYLGTTSQTFRPLQTIHSGN